MPTSNPASLFTNTRFTAKLPKDHRMEKDSDGTHLYFVLSFGLYRPW